MDYSFNLYLGVAIITIGYGFQMFKVLMSKSVNDLSVFAYIAGVISVFVMWCFAEDYELRIITAYGTVVSMAALLQIVYYKKGKEMNTENKGILYIAIFGSLFMIYGLAQAIKSFNQSGGTRDVSSLSYLVWITSSLNQIYLAESSLIIISAGVSISLYVYIVMRCRRPRFIHIAGVWRHQ